jgi:hypothetical protein
VYSDDADRINAFGTVKHGRDDIVADLRGLFADANFDRASSQGRRRPPTPTEGDFLF